MKKHQLLLAVAVLTCGLLTGCTDSDEMANGNKRVVNMLEEVKPIQLTPAQKVFVNDNNQFTLNFLKTVSETDHSGKSFIYSPLSITFVLGMVNDAATGLTEQELEQTLGFHEGGIQAVNEYCKNLIDNLMKVDVSVQLDIANAIFLNKDYTLKKQYEQDVATYYDAKAEVLNFSSPETLNHINDWCKKKTEGMIPTILDELNPDAASYLLNAIYFKADWTSKFDKNNTKTEIFTTEKGSTKLPLMHQTVLITYKDYDTFSAVNIPYGNGMWSMTVMLPGEGKTTDDVIAALAQNGLAKDGWREDDYSNSPLYGLTPHEVDLKLPCFDTTSDTDDMKGGLISLMQKMGISRAFDAHNEEIQNMVQLPVYIKEMRQKAAIKVNEEGAEAAAVTVAEMVEKSSMDEPQEYPKATFHADRPFVYVIREATSGVILFVGKFTGE